MEYERYELRQSDEIFRKNTKVSSKLATLSS